MQIYNEMKVETDREQVVAMIDSVSSSLSNQKLQDGTSYLEVSTTTPLACGYDQALKVIHKGMMRKETLSNKHLISVSVLSQ